MRRLLQYAAAILALLTIALWFTVRSLGYGKLHVYVLDIGQGDSILIETPSKQRILIDGGPNDHVLTELAKVMPLHERRIDLIILTHPHADHMDGLIEVLKRYEVGQAMITAASYHSAGYDLFLHLLREKEVPIIFAGKPATDYRLGFVFFDMLYPFSSVQGEKFDNLNNSSIVFRLIYGKRIFYFSGDLEMEKEVELVESDLHLNADFYKVAHHGSKTSSTDAFINRIHPRFAAISCGVDNSFHHPYAGTVDKLHARNIVTYRTDLDGIIEAVSDGFSLDVWSQGKEV